MTLYLCPSASVENDLSTGDARLSRAVPPPTTYSGKSQQRAPTPSSLRIPFSLGPTRCCNQMASSVGWYWIWGCKSFSGRPNRKIRLIEGVIRAEVTALTNLKLCEWFRPNTLSYIETARFMTGKSIRLSFRSNSHNCCIQRLVWQNKLDSSCLRNWCSPKLVLTTAQRFKYSLYHT